MGLLIGMDYAKFLASKMTTFHPIQFPGIFLWTTPLNPLPFFGGGMKSKVKGEFRTFSYATTSASRKPCNKAKAHHNGCRDMDAIAKDFLPLPLKKMIAMILLLMNSSLITHDSSSSSFLLLQTPNLFLCGPSQVIASKVDWTLRHHNKGTGGNNHHGSKQTLSHYQSDQRLANHPSSYMKMSPALASIEDSTGVSNLACSLCTRAMANCRRCAYINSSLSIKDLEELEILTKCISVIDTKEGKRILVTYPLQENALEYFSAKNTNREAARINTIRLYERLKKNKLLDSYHEEMMKSLERGHISFYDAYHPKMEPQLFIFQNYSLKDDSTSQACRPVSNSGTKNKSGHDLNSMTIAGPNYMCNGPSVFFSFRLHPVGFTLDVSRCYRSLVTDEQTNRLRLFYWYRDKDDKDSLSIMRYERMTYGDRPAQCVLELSFRTIVSPECKMETSRGIIANSRIVDDCCASLRDEDEVNEAIQDITQAFGKFSFSIKHAIKTGDDVDPQMVLGTLWDTQLDTISVKTVLNLHPKRRGRSIGQPLSKENIPNAVLDKTSLARLSGESWEYLNCLIGPIQATIRILFSIASVQLKDWVTPLHLVDKELDNQIRSILLNLIDLPKRIKPMSRCLIPKSFTLRRIALCSDSGKYGMACTLHLISSNDKGEPYSSIFYSKPKANHMSVPDGEFCALVLSLKTLS